MAEWADRLPEKPRSAIKLSTSIRDFLERNIPNLRCHLPSSLFNPTPVHFQYVPTLELTYKIGIISHNFMAFQQYSSGEDYIISYWIFLCYPISCDKIVRIGVVSCARDSIIFSNNHTKLKRTQHKKIRKNTISPILSDLNSFSIIFQLSAYHHLITRKSPLPIRKLVPFVHKSH